MHTYVSALSDLGKTSSDTFGGKAANLGELCTIQGIHVPRGCCISTAAFKEIISSNARVAALIQELSQLQATEKKSIAGISAVLRQTIASVEIPGQLVNEIMLHLEIPGSHPTFAIRSSATAEDLADASFAGQQDSYLNITGKASILTHISRCWASLFTERAVLYRIQNGFSQAGVYLSVIIQEMVPAEASGIMFTADPVTGNRKVVSIDAGFGLGEAIVSGIVNTDVYKVMGNAIISRKISSKKQGMYASQQGGTKLAEIDYSKRDQQVLTDAQIIRLAETGSKIARHFTTAQDVEWCLAGGIFYIVQSRPVTTLFPIPEGGANNKHIYVSVGHQQMMTDAIKPLGLSIWQLTAPRPMFTAGGRLFVDIMQDLSTATGRNMVMNVLGKSDPLIKTALLKILQRQDLFDTSNDAPVQQSDNSHPPHTNLQEYTAEDVAALISKSEQSIMQLKQAIRNKSGVALIEFIEQDIQQYRQSVACNNSIGIIMSGISAAQWLNEKMQEWLGEKNVANKLSQSLANNITAQMGLALLDVADVIRPYKNIIAYLRHTSDNHFLNVLPSLENGEKVKKAIGNFLEKYGMRCEGEIDITRPRWSEEPVTLIPLLLANIDGLKAGESKRRFEKGLQEARQQETALLERLQQLPGAALKMQETKQQVHKLRTLAGYREYPKYHMVSRYFAYKQALLQEAGELVQQNKIHHTTDIFYLGLEEIKYLLQYQHSCNQLIDERKQAYRHYNKLMPPRIFTGDGEIITGSYEHAQLPAGAIGGLAVSSGVAEGRARIIYNLANADLQPGDILVTRFTDPGWTPLFVSIKALVTEVGGLMTHGSVIAREYGLPAVVGVENATQLIMDGRQIRVNGTDGNIELL
ncbi:phosphoenolpyruvate synthase [Panacibacter sp. DH6]|uniref:Prodigiosin synthesizing transferase PigC n=1 Tax=Panacibacter microcysteis TaxID=2793269 RepID=A0A931EBG9_9BACT|nr:rifamycin-inactivating phosphotransferase [Panacibacter microcysteis]MBG9377506.1 phosphoenolpyruvate synthase [Panacibacter microcysteis]